MLASIHSKLSDDYRRQDAVFSSLLLVISTFLVGVVFISEDFVQTTVGLSANGLKWIIGIASICNFCGVLLVSQWGFQKRATEHREAVRFYFGIFNKIRRWQDSGIPITDEMIEEIRSDYARTQTLPKILEARFLRLKQWHLQKIAVSRELDKTPFEPISSIKERLKSDSKKGDEM